jgi:serine/threonine-protein kinase HipA
MTYRSVFVYADWEGLPEENVLMGQLQSELLRGKEVFSFVYSKEWLSSNFAQALDPDLVFSEGLQYLSDDKTNFGLFLDSSPDRWGRVLLRRREAAMARFEKRAIQNLTELDFLLGVFDGNRMGGLRFKREIDGPFLDDNKQYAVPAWTSIRELEQISLRLENDEASNDPDYLRWLSLLVAPGSSLGGARPKASVVDAKGSLWIAKFPSVQDTFDVGAWELVAHRLAIKAGIEMAEAKAEIYSTKHHTFLTKRFDRTSSGKRKHFASAMTLLGHSDGQDGASYLELVEFISRQGANVQTDLAQLYRRIAFSIAVSNVDDHLRNHGFLWTQDGWILSPAYDINPVETGSGLHLNISDIDNSLDWDLLKETAPFYRLEPEMADKIIQEVKEVVKEWEKEARSLGINTSERDLKSNAFRMAFIP